MGEGSVTASFWTMVFLQTLGSFDPVPGTGPRKMPPPAAYVPIIIAWSILQVVADAGWGRAAAKFGWLMVLVGMVLGPFGKRLIGLFNWVSQLWGIPITAAQRQAGSSNSGNTQAPTTTGPI